MWTVETTEGSDDLIFVGFRASIKKGNQTGYVQQNPPFGQGQGQGLAHNGIIDCYTLMEPGGWGGEQRKRAFSAQMTYCKGYG